MYEQDPGYQEMELRLDMRSSCLRIHMYVCICVCVSGTCELWEALDSC